MSKLSRAARSLSQFGRQVNTATSTSLNSVRNATPTSTQPGLTQVPGRNSVLGLPTTPMLAPYSGTTLVDQATNVRGTSPDISPSSSAQNLTNTALPEPPIKKRVDKSPDVLKGPATVGDFRRAVDAFNEILNNNNASPEAKQHAEKKLRELEKIPNNSPSEAIANVIGKSKKQYDPLSQMQSAGSTVFIVTFKVPAVFAGSFIMCMLWACLEMSELLMEFFGSNLEKQRRKDGSVSHVDHQYSNAMKESLGNYVEKSIGFTWTNLVSAFEGIYGDIAPEFKPDKYDHRAGEESLRKYFEKKQMEFKEEDSLEFEPSRQSQALEGADGGSRFI